jgi:hypothetical protein
MAGMGVAVPVCGYGSLIKGFSYFQLKEKTAVFSQRKTEKKKAILQGRLEGLSRFPVKKFYR